ncbi:hypothetical protein [Photobacterium kishitanii]|uniref:Uncharacterized protein n=1 Tax=Photobacterium kishitanii TaxID=318456 RepID=A0A2T3KMF9_9GAMM|nr:hypothetical protein [Photobacterium kishitanii]PSV00983.1 hypothetical protein C9J27_02865 [Photobacterium kishitanii]
MTNEITQQKQKRFIFFTGGTDSTLILHFLLELIQKRKEDELVIVIIAGVIRSGTNDKIINSLKLAANNIITKNLSGKKDVLDRISIALINTELHSNEEFEITAKGSNNKSYNLSLNRVSHDPVVIPTLKSLVLQELTLMSSLPLLTQFLGSCKNTFYVGACGTDLATQSADKLTQYIKLFYEIAMLSSNGDNLSAELALEGIPSFSRNNTAVFNPEWIPTLEMPLRMMRKQDVVMALISLKNTSFDVDKKENLVEHYSMEGKLDEMLQNHISLYHDIRVKHGYPDDYPSLLNFIRSKELRFGDTVYTEEDLNNTFNSFSMNLFDRIFKSQM